MKATDLDLARICFKEKSLTLAIAKDGNIIFESRLRGVSSFLEAIRKLDGQLEGASVADKVTGRAVALLCIYSRVKSVYSEMLSYSAGMLLEKSKVLVESGRVVETILNSDKTDVCPFEKLLSKVKSPETAYRRLVHRCSISGKKEA